MDLQNAKLLEKINCLETYPATKYFEYGQTQIISQNNLQYREADSHPSARFGYRFQITALEQPHRVVIQYPDDKRRYMCIMDGTCYDLTVGVFTGLAQPLSGSMLTMAIDFWPRWTDCSIVFMTYSEGEPAAVANICIYELPDLTPLDSQTHPNSRVLGIEYEDPCGISAAEGSIDHAQWTEHILAYMRHSGQKRLIYPMVWYHGPLFPSGTDISDYGDLVATADRKQYIRWVTAPADWYLPLLRRFETEGVEFQGALTLLRLSSLMKQMNQNIRAIRLGKDTINSMLWNDQVQSGTGDWTAIHNAINYNHIARKVKRNKPYPGFRLPWGVGYAYGEHNRRGCHGGPIFNPLHPKVQEALLKFIQDAAQRYAVSPAFKGFSINMYASCILWFGSLHSGYDDYAVSLFEKESCIKIPISKKDPHRFSKRYQYLTYQCKEAWITWRCEKIRLLFRKIRDQLQAIRSDLELTITLWDETLFFPLLGQIGSAHQVFARSSNYNIFREAGIDIPLYKDEIGIHLDIGIGCTRDRGGHPPNATAGVNILPEHSSMYRDFDFLDSPLHTQFAHNSSPGAYIFNSWVEAWGKHVWYQCDPNDPNLKDLRNIDGKPAEGILSINSLYPKDGFWWDSQLRIVPGFPAGDHFLEPYAHAMAEYDACRISRGGLFLDKGHTDQIREFSRGFQALPNQKFTQVGNSIDPIAVRQLHTKDATYFYLINRDYYSIEVTVKLNAETSSITNLKTMDEIKTTNILKFQLKAYELQVFRGPFLMELKDFSCKIPEEIEKNLQQEMDKALEIMTRAKNDGYNIPGIESLAEKITIAWRDHRYAWLRRALTGYIVRKCYALEKN